MAKRRRPKWVDWLVLGGLAALFAGVYAFAQLSGGAERALIRAGGGEVHYVAVRWLRCREFPGQTPRRERLNRFRGSATPPEVTHRNRFEIVARRDGYALGGVDGEICWLPLWALQGTEPPWQPCGRRGPDYYRPYPPGWVEPPPAFDLNEETCGAPPAPAPVTSRRDPV